MTIKNNNIMLMSHNLIIGNICTYIHCKAFVLGGKGALERVCNLTSSMGHHSRSCHRELGLVHTVDTVTDISEENIEF